MTITHRTLNQIQALEAMGITRWVARDSVPLEAEGGEVQNPEVVELAQAEVAPVKVESMDWEPLQQQVASCDRCGLHLTRTQTVFGTGSQHADWLIIGEAPGEQEDLQGVPFVGRAGILLNNMLQAIGLSRDAVYIANVVKCRPPGNRDPAAEESRACFDYLQRQVALLNPRLILVVGRIAAQTLLKTDTPVGKLRGRVHRYPDTHIPMVVTYHPAYLLRRPSEKKKSWEDLKLALSTLKS